MGSEIPEAKSAIRKHPIAPFKTVYRDHEAGQVGHVGEWPPP